MITAGSLRKPLRWIASSRGDLRKFPKQARVKVGYALYFAEMGGKHESAKPLKGFGGASVLEIRLDSQGNTFRAVYTVSFADVVYVLHVFQKKSKKGIATPKHDIELVRQRLKTAELEYRKEFAGTEVEK